MNLYHKLSLITVAVAVVLSLCSCQSGLEYTDADVVLFDSIKGGKQLPFKTPKGRQLAFYVSPRSGVKKPDPLIILFPGIGSRALDRLDWVEKCPDPDAGFLLVDYPGRGRCEGVLQPSRLPDTTNGALNALSAFLKSPRNELEKDLRVAGHSFGCGASLQFAAHTNVKTIVLLAPFTTMKRALFRKMGPLAWLIPDNLDNRKNLRRVVAGDSVPGITIIHGAKDPTIPLYMAQQLKAIAPDRVSLITVDDGTHVSILKTHMDSTFKILLED